MKVPDCAAAVIAGMLIYLTKTSIQSFERGFFCCGTSDRGRFFIMSGSVTNVNGVKSGTCPHGASPGACPICSGMGGGGRMGERPQKAGEWSYHKCAMIGALMRARENRIETHEKNLLNHAEALKAFEQSMINASAKMAEFVANIQKNILLKPVAFVLSLTLVPILNIIKNIPNFILNIGEKLAQIKEKLHDIQDKLNAIFGEAKAFIEKKVSEIVSSITTKFKSLYQIFQKENAKDEDNKIDEDKKIFRLKTFINKILGKKKDDTENKSRS